MWLLLLLLLLLGPLPLLPMPLLETGVSIAPSLLPVLPFGGLLEGVTRDDEENDDDGGLCGVFPGRFPPPPDMTGVLARLLLPASGVAPGVRRCLAATAAGPGVRLTVGGPPPPPIPTTSIPSP